MEKLIIEFELSPETDYEDLGYIYFQEDGLDYFATPNGLVFQYPEISRGIVELNPLAITVDLISKLAGNAKSIQIDTGKECISGLLEKITYTPVGNAMFLISHAIKKDEELADGFYYVGDTFFTIDLFSEENLKIVFS